MDLTLATTVLWYILSKKSYDSLSDYPTYMKMMNFSSSIQDYYTSFPFYRPKKSSRIKVWRLSMF